MGRRANASTFSSARRSSIWLNVRPIWSATMSEDPLAASCATTQRWVDTRHTFDGQKLICWFRFAALRNGHRRFLIRKSVIRLFRHLLRRLQRLLYRLQFLRLLRLLCLLHLRHRLRLSGNRRRSSNLRPIRWNAESPRWHPRGLWAAGMPNWVNLRSIQDNLIIWIAFFNEIQVRGRGWLCWATIIRPTASAICAADRWSVINTSLRPLIASTTNHCKLFNSFFSEFPFEIFPTCYRSPLAAVTATI